MLISQPKRVFETRRFVATEQRAVGRAVLPVMVACLVAAALGSLVQDAVYVIAPLIFLLSLLAWRWFVLRLPAQAGWRHVLLGGLIVFLNDGSYTLGVLYAWSRGTPMDWLLAAGALCSGVLICFAVRSQPGLIVYRDRTTFGVVFLGMPLAIAHGGADLVMCLVAGAVGVLGFGLFLVAHIRILHMRQTVRRAMAGELQRQKLEAMGQLTGGVAHDFNNLLTVIQGNLDLLALSPSGEEQHQFLAEASDAARRAAKLTSRLLSYSRRQNLDPERIAAGDVIAGDLVLLRRLLTAQHRLEVNLAEKSPAIHADRNHLQTVLVNLIVNARDASPEGGVISLAISPARLVEGYGPRGTENLRGGMYLVITVTDNGVGIAADDLARVTEPFYTTKSNGRGSGLGLAMAEGFARQSGGAMSIASTEGIGTRVSLWFPALPEMKAGAA